MYELNRQGILDYKLWPAILDTRLVQRGVSQAHKQIVQYAKDACMPEITIMEDDVKFPGEDGYAYYLRNMPADFDIYLGGIYRGVIKAGKISGVFGSLHLYTVRAKFYDTFLSVDETLHLDNGLSELNGDYHVCYPFAAIQYDGWSDTEQAPTNHHGLLRGKLIHK